MTFTITGADSSDQGPSGCVARFMAASAAGDSDAAMAEIHPACREGLSGGAHAPPGVVAVEVQTPEPGESGTRVPTRLIGSDGTEQRFVFVVRPHDAGCGIDLPASMEATFGGDPAQLVEQALRAAVEPLAEGFAQMSEALGQAMGGSDSGGAPAARRIPVDAALPASAASLPESLTAQVLELDLHHCRRRDDLQSDWQTSAELNVRFAFELDPAWTALATLGVVLSAATSCEGDDLRPADAGEDLGAESYSSWEREARNAYVKLALSLPGGACSGLRELAGIVRLSLVGGELLEIALGPVGSLIGSRVELPALDMAMELAREDGQLTLRVASGGFDRFEDIVPIDAAGETINQSWGGSGDGQTDSRTYSSEIPDDATLLLRFWSRREQIVVPFTVAELPLQLRAG
jgi:hypothetical protein